MKTPTLLASLVLFAFTTVHGVEPRLPALFADHMVLQRDAAVPVWGWAEAGADVVVEFGGQKKTAKADATGKWMAKVVIRNRFWPRFRNSRARYRRGAR